MKIINLDRTITLFFSFLCGFLAKSDTEIQPAVYKTVLQENLRNRLVTFKILVSQASGEITTAENLTCSVFTA